LDIILILAELAENMCPLTALALQLQNCLSASSLIIKIKPPDFLGAFWRGVHDQRTPNLPLYHTFNNLSRGFRKINKKNIFPKTIDKRLIM
jgi:hypothetical protein